ncbi:MAG TPA: heavy metal-binding domain-containing protein [Woeseiaceae bacterium]|nr:heavy metal-binding domain-containing protein [Woeseiaceae bacterium]
MDSSFELISMFANILLPIAGLLFAFFVGNLLEKNHFKSIREREAANHSFPVVTFDTMPEAWNVNRAEMVTGSIVVSLDYFKRVIAWLRGLVGGRVKTYEPLLDRARREAVLRMIESAKSQGYDAIFNVRLETSRLANARRDGKGIAGVEMLAFGTAVKFVSRFSRSQ